LNHLLLEIINTILIIQGECIAIYEYAMVMSFKIPHVFAPIDT